MPLTKETKPSIYADVLGKVDSPHEQDYLNKILKIYVACLIAEIALYFSPEPEIDVQAQIKYQDFQCWFSRMAGSLY